jgi:hypothetical protein
MNEAHGSQMNSDIFSFCRTLAKSNSFKSKFLKFRINEINFIKIQNQFLWIPF